MTLTNQQREILGRWLPVALVIIGACLLMRWMKNAFWTMFGLAWVLFWVMPWRWWH